MSRDATDSVQAPVTLKKNILDCKKVLKLSENSFHKHQLLTEIKTIKLYKSFFLDGLEPEYKEYDALDGWRCLSKGFLKEEEIF